MSRFGLRPTLGIEIGGGYVFGCGMENPGPSLPVGRHLGVKAGVTFVFNLDTTNFQPIAVGVIRF